MNNSQRSWLVPGNYFVSKHDVQWVALGFRWPAAMGLKRVSASHTVLGASPGSLALRENGVSLSVWNWRRIWPTVEAAEGLSPHASQFQEWPSWPLCHQRLQPCGCRWIGTPGTFWRIQHRCGPTSEEKRGFFFIDICSNKYCCFFSFGLIPYLSGLHLYWGHGVHAVQHCRACLIERCRFREQGGGWYSAVSGGYRSNLPLEKLQNNIYVCCHAGLQPAEQERNF